MLQRLRLVLLSVALLIGACATAHNYPPVAVEGRPDTMQFKIFTSIGVPESEADRVAASDFEAYKAKSGYTSYVVEGRRWNHLPTYFEYTVRFTR